ncbi:Exosome complex component csl4 [Schizosaccharomyces pombe]|uniref:Exosome complex component csl4 n=1 Tax=Schizosaccharomyces pombe (strain 972 / ATCC 24843) TaxID=284812 RepID=CSL4_SCHPO|nr:putative exosome subunit Csl4 [Schizosaccharomyces pombe]O59821.2 RecName: Full=Exosome complex component csl4 [Schizosaccharomyces pombe 972h-]CAA20134.1 exosome subunit Csl4 (predicted) [Schizosaccharomyces pombe]|eukprot:NP_588510.1 putative exosome subunit Csl4 [Schizosaccharomyces pombe]
MNLVLPGQVVARGAPNGEGTVKRGDYIISTRTGIFDPEKNSVTYPRKVEETAVLPNVGSIVLARVSRINARQATVNISVVDDVCTKDEFQGVIHVQDIRATEKNKVKVQNSFRPGDIVRALVISLGDGSSYFLTTARNDLGVIFAQSSETGEQMFPVDYQHMQTKSGYTEMRKCAKPILDE